MILLQKVKRDVMAYTWDTGGGDDHTSGRGHVSFKRGRRDKNSTSRS